MGSDAGRALPQQFSELEPFVAQWAVRTMRERHRRRLASSADDRQTFYEAMSPKLDAVMDHLNRFPLHDMPMEAAKLLELAMALMEVALTQEVYDADIEAVHARSSKLVRIGREMDEL
jgi:hypothetical protein